MNIICRTWAELLSWLTGFSLATLALKRLEPFIVCLSHFSSNYFIVFPVETNEIKSLPRGRVSFLIGLAFSILK